jgi:hypothetical protein
MTERSRQTLLDLYRAILAVFDDLDTIDTCRFRIFCLWDAR